ncbi:MAG TPA: hypothetical protein VHK91_00065 [Flavisolibacter sp.]|jgi:O-methyltransferase involved in polyketide biosynthesis|nr:hypothetical protein [Flavisolibacter sp.]
MQRNYAAISPTARALLVLKGITTIPYARTAAELASRPGTYRPDTENTDLAYWKRVVHFEIRYRTVDQLLEELPVTNVLELSSGFSFRGLDNVQRRALHYIDTDLPEVIDEKKAFLQDLSDDEQPAAGQLDTLPLNALDEDAFLATVNLFTEGPVAIVNEGLLMYLGEGEKETLCRIIRRVLQQRGGWWITGDIYVKSTLERFNNKEEDRLKSIVTEQRIEDNMFDSFEAAEQFFQRNDFEVDKEAEVDIPAISSIPYLVRHTTPEQLDEMRRHPKIQATWRLKVA